MTFITSLDPNLEVRSDISTGSNAQVTIEDNVRVRIHTISVRLKTDATVINRTFMIIVTSALAPAIRLANTPIITASQDIWTFLRAGMNQSQVTNAAVGPATIVNTGLGESFTLIPGDSIVAFCQNLQAADEVSLFVHLSRWTT